MTIRLNFNAAAIHANANLANADKLIAQSIARLSSGERIQRPADDPAGLTIANALRHHLRGIEQASRNIENGVSMVQTAEGAMDGISQLLLKARSLAVSAANEGANEQAQLDAYQTELDELLGALDRIANDTSFGGRKLLQGELAQTTLDPAARAVWEEVRLDHRSLPGGIRPGSTITLGPPSGDLSRDRIVVDFGAGTPATQTVQGATQNGVVLDDAIGRNVTITGPRGSSTFTVTATTTLGQVVSLVNANSSLTGARASYDAATGALQIDSESFGGGTLSIASEDMVLGAGTAGLLDSDSGSGVNAFYQAGSTPTMDLAWTDAAGDAQNLTLMLDSSSPGGRSFITTDAGPELVPPFTAWAAGAFTVTLRDTSDGTVGSTISAPTIAHSATRISPVRIQSGGQTGQTITVEIDDLRSRAIGRVESLFADGVMSLSDVGDKGLLRFGRAQEALQVIDQAIADLNRSRGRAGAIQGDALETTLASLQVSMENLTAAESRIRDTDMAFESAEYAKQNIRLQAATAMLAQANQVPQSILALLQG